MHCGAKISNIILTNSVNILYSQTVNKVSQLSNINLSKHIQPNFKLNTY